MGVKGGRFLPVLKDLCLLMNIEYRRNLYDLCEERAMGIDGHGFLHRAVSIPHHALAIIFDDDYTEAASVFGIWMTQIVEHGVAARVVFDGAVTPGKEAEKADRTSSAASALEIVRGAGRDADFQGDKDLKAALQKAAGGFCNRHLITTCLDELHEIGLSGIVAPFEGDGQLALMSRHMQVDYVLTPDSDLIVHGCTEVLLTPIGGDDRLRFDTGDIVYHLPVKKLCSDLMETRQLREQCEDALATAAAAGKTISASEEDQARWMGACLSKHGIPGLRTLAVLLGCDYSGGGYPGVGMAKLLPVLLSAGPSVTSVFAALEKSYPPPGAFVPDTPPPPGLVVAIAVRLGNKKSLGFQEAKQEAETWSSGQRGRRRTKLTGDMVKNALKVAKAAGSPGRDELLKAFCDAELIFKHSLAYDLKRHKVRLCLCGWLAAAAASSFRD
jgi:5'-3' exonuclease